MKSQSGPFRRRIGAGILALCFDAMPLPSIAVVDSPVSRLYEIRGQVMEGANLARSVMNCVVESPWCPTDGISGNYVSAITMMAPGEIDIIYGNLAFKEISGKTLSLTAYVTPALNIVWRCGNQPEPQGLQSLWWGDYVPSTVDDQYSVAACAAITAFPSRDMDLGDAIRGRVAQGLRYAAYAQKWIEQFSTTIWSLSAAADSFNSLSMGVGIYTPFLSAILINNGTGEIMVNYNSATVGLTPGQDTLVLSPYAFTEGGFVPLALASGMFYIGSIEWGCTSASSISATNRGFAGAATGTLPPEYAPPECR